jgi:hypothetical protein
MPLSVIGAGFGRTGTLSLRIALERLGLGPCYHMLEVFQHPKHIRLWDRAADGKPVDWEKLLGGYRSAVDWPVCAFYWELAMRYPEAKVILTVREPESWYRSAAETILRVMTQPLPEGDAVLQAQLRMARKLIVEQTLGGWYENREHAIAVYERHNAAVKRTIPPERLLVYEVAHGWEPLCRFLGLPVPEEPFPQVNTTEEFRQRIVTLRKADAAAAAPEGPPT